MAYIRQHQLPNLKNYKYSGVDHSLTSYYILKPFYTNFVIKFFPYNPTLDQDCPPWVYASWAIGLFLYQTFDAVDGTQARRTRQSGPLGELFDHGVDALNTSLGVLIFAASQNFGLGWKTVWSLFGAMLTFYIQTWDEYQTKTLTLGIVNGPVEGVLILICIYSLTAYKGGASFWQQSATHAIGIPKHAYIPRYVFELSISDVYSIVGSFVLVLNAVQSSLNVVRARHACGQKSRAAFLGLVPFFLTWFLISVYLYLNPETLYHHLVPFILFAGLVNAYSVGQIITAHLVQQPFPYFNVLVLPIAYGVFDSLGPVFQKYFGFGWSSFIENGSYQSTYCICMLVFALAIYGSFVVDIIVTICDHLDIWCLTIKHPWNQKAGSAENIKKTK